MIPFSVLDLAPIVQGSTPTQAFQNMVALARHAESCGYERYWLAEHHSIPGIASAATAVLVGHVLGATRRLRVGAGGIMLPNHAPLVIAEQFGTLEALYPGRVDLALGRAPGSDQTTARALRRYQGAADSFPQDVVELHSYFAPPQPGQSVRAVPGSGLEVPLWILGSSLFGAQLAAMLGLPYAFASHFAPGQLEPAIEVYRAQFRPSAQCDAPYVLLAVNVIAADTDAEARRLFTTVQQQFVNLRRGTLGLVPPPIDDIDTWWSPTEKAQVQQALACSAVGAPESVRAMLKDFIRRHRPDELMLTGQIYDPVARLRSFGIAAEVRDSLAGAASGPG